MAKKTPAPKKAEEKVLGTSCWFGKACSKLTCPGKTSLWLIGGHVLFMLVFNLVSILYQPATELRTPYEIAAMPLSIPLALAGLAGIASFVFGLIAIFKAKERSVFVVLATVYGFAILLFAIGEFAFDH